MKPEREPAIPHAVAYETIASPAPGPKVVGSNSGSTVAGVALTVRRRGRLLSSALGVALAVSFLAAVGIGAVPINPATTLRILGHRLAGLSSNGIDPQLDAVLWTIRLPRVLLAMLVGAALGVSGAALQGVFRNPLADPALIGVSSGAAVGAIGAIVLGAGALGYWTLPVAAFGGGVAAAFAVYGLAQREGRVEPVTLVLCGVAMNAMCGAAIGLLISVADDAQLRDISFWQLGSVGAATWELVRVCAPFVAGALIFLPSRAKALDLFVLGEREARHLGVDVEKTRLVVIGLAALATGACVAVAGILGFVGLIVPHLVRLVAGPGHRLLLRASAIGGALVLVLADLAARTVAVPREVPLGVMTAIIGSPVFLWLIRWSRRQFGGFA